MSAILISDILLWAVKTFFTNPTEEIGKKIGADLYSRIKKFLKRDEERTLLSNVESSPSCEVTFAELQLAIIRNLNGNTAFYQEISMVLAISPAKAQIIEMTMSSMKRIVLELRGLLNQMVDVEGSTDVFIKQIDAREKALIDLEGRLVRHLNLVTR